MAVAAMEAVAPQGHWNEERTIKEMFRSEWDVITPRESQIEAIKSLMKNGSLKLIQPTGSGKSLVFLGAATIRRGVSICLVPLHGLGSNQTAKANTHENLTSSVVAIHADELRGDALTPIEKYLLSTGKDCFKHHSLILYISAKRLVPGEPWRNIVEHFAKQQLVRMVCFDEAHEVPLQGEEFRKEYGKLGVNLVNVVERYQKDVAIYLAMSATFPLNLQVSFERMVGRKFEATLWGRMERRSIAIMIDIVGSKTVALKNIIAPYVEGKDHKESKVLLYTGMRERAQGSLLKQMKKFLPDSDAMALTGKTGIKEKSWLVDLFAGSIESEVCKLQILIGTAAIKCGISSDLCKLVACEGFLRSLLEVVQVMGRGCRVRGESGRIAFVLTLELFMSVVDFIRQAK